MGTETATFAQAAIAMQRVVLLEEQYTDQLALLISTSVTVAVSLFLYPAQFQKKLL